MLHPTRLLLAVSFLALASLTVNGCSREPKEGVATATPSPPAISCEQDGGIQLGCPAFPNTTPQAQPDWDYFAWNSFIAANWPAVIPANNNEQRGFPDLTQSFASVSNDALLVWETFKEKREIFLNASTSSGNVPGPWNQAPVYGPLDETIPLCSDSLNHPQGRRPRRFFGQGSKVVFDSLDETVEVLSEALEDPSTQLCAGYSTNPMCGTPQQASCCLVANLAVGPRVWKGSPTKPQPQPVVYEVKLNYDYFEYVLNNSLYVTATAQTNAANAQILLPYRTSASSGPQGAPPDSGVTSYSAQQCLTSVYQQVTPASNLNPCLVGSMQIKTAWIPLVDEDQSKYHTAEAAYFKTENGQTCMSYAIFGLVGIHIIQRIHQGSGQGNAAAVGGTYIFATFEHVDNDIAGFTYANCLPPQSSGSPPSGFYPAPSSALPVKRMYPILANTRTVNDQVHAAIGSDSVWQNYHLIGTQFQAINTSQPPAQKGAQSPFPVGPNDPTGIGQPLFLANLVIETNDGLQNFQGLPPNITPISQFAKFIPGNATPAYNRGTQNLPFTKTGYNMGGCMGCHGVAAVKGYSFSFVLLDGQAGAGVDTQQSFSIPPGPVGPVTACNSM